MAPEISREIPIGELIINYPAAFEVLLRRGFHCMGCGMAAYETLGQGAAAHGLDDAALDSLIAELKEAVAKQAKVEKAIRECAPKKGKRLVIKPKPVEKEAQEPVKKPEK